MFDAAAEWQAADFGSLFSLNTPGFWGDDPSGEANVLVLRSTNFKKTGGLNYETAAPRRFDQRKLVQKLLVPGDIILERSGGSPAQPVGRVNRFDADGHYSASNFMQILRPHEHVDSHYAYYLLDDFYRRGGTETLQKATTGIRNLDFNAYLATPILLPPLDEQRRIAEVLRSVDEAIAATDAVLGAAATVRQSALDALMRALVEADGSERVLSEVAEVRTGLAKNKNASGRHIQLPYLRVANVQDGWFDLSDMQEIAVEADKVDRYSLRDGDVLLTEGGDYDKLGRGGVWKAQVRPCLHQNHVFCVRSDQTRLLPEFLALVTQSYLGRAYFLSCAKRTTNLASINSSQLKALPVPLPGLERQAAVIGEIGCIDAVIEHEKEKLRSLQRLRVSQASDLLSGRLRVPL